MNILITSLFRTFATMYVYTKIIPRVFLISVKEINNKVFFLILFVISALTQQFCFAHFSMIYILELCLCMSVIYGTEFILSLWLSTLSYAIYYCAYTVCSLLTAVILSPLHYYKISSPNELAFIITGILTSAFTVVILKTKRLKSGMQFLSNTQTGNIGIIICLLILILKSADNFNTDNSMYKTNIYLGSIVPLGIFVLAILLFVWWRKMITKSYIAKIRRLELQSLYEEIEEKERNIQKLAEDNERLARIIHKDNKLIPAMEHAVTQFLQKTETSDSSTLASYGKQLSAQLSEMAQDRKGILKDYDSGNFAVRQTGNVSIDAVLAYMQKKAAANHTAITCRYTSENLQQLLDQVLADDVSHMLSDLLENALIATQTESKRHIHVTFGKLDKDSYLSIADTGCSFDIETLHLFGIHTHTTHQEDGGSGIGLTDLWQLKKKYRASIQIQEYAPGNNFSKKITVLFDRKNHYVIQSFRHKEISITKTRNDLYIVPPETYQNTEEHINDKGTKSIIA